MVGGTLKPSRLRPCLSVAKRSDRAIYRYAITLSKADRIHLFILPYRDIQALNMLSAYVVSLRT